MTTFYQRHTLDRRRRKEDGRDMDAWYSSLQLWLLDHFCIIITQEQDYQLSHHVIW